MPETQNAPFPPVSHGLETESGETPAGVPAIFPPHNLGTNPAAIRGVAITIRAAKTRQPAAAAFSRINGEGGAHGKNRNAAPSKAQTSADRPRIAGTPLVRSHELCCAVLADRTQGGRATCAAPPRPRRSRGPARYRARHAGNLAPNLLCGRSQGGRAAGAACRRSMVAVRTPDVALAHDLRQDLGSLTGKLTRRICYGAVHADQRRLFKSLEPARHPGRPGFLGGHGQNPQQGGSGQQQQPQDERGRRPDWVEEMENSLAHRQATGARHGH